MPGKKHLVGLMVAVVFAVPILAAETLSGRCVEVISGDTIIVDVDGEALTIVLDGIDAPENGQPFGTEAKEMLSELALGKTVTIEGAKPGDSGVVNARVATDSTALSLAMLEAGGAWHDIENNQDEQLLMAAIIARGAGTGLWANPNPVRPAEWRKLQKATPVPTAGPRNLAELAEQRKLKTDADGKVVISGAGGGSGSSSSGSGSPAASSVPSGSFLVKQSDHQMIPSKAFDCLRKRPDLELVGGPYYKSSSRYGSERVNYTIGVWVPDPENKKTGKRSVHYEWVGLIEGEYYRFNCEDLINRFP